MRKSYQPIILLLGIPPGSFCHFSLLLHLHPLLLLKFTPWFHRTRPAGGFTFTGLNQTMSVRWQRGTLMLPRNNPGFMFQPFFTFPQAFTQGDGIQLYWCIEHKLTEYKKHNGPLFTYSHLSLTMRMPASTYTCPRGPLHLYPNTLSNSQETQGKATQMERAKFCLQ